MNNTELKKIGYLKPNQIHSEIDSAFVRSAQKQNNIKILTEPNWKDQKKSEDTYNFNKTNIQIGKIIND